MPLAAGLSKFQYGNFLPFETRGRIARNVRLLSRARPLLVMGHLSSFSFPIITGSIANGAGTTLLWFSSYSFATYVTLEKISMEESAQKQLWQQSLEEKKGRIIGKKNAEMIATLDYDTFQKRLPQLLENYSKKKVTKFLQCLDPAVEGLKVFTAAISSMTQANSVGTLLWGSLQLLLEVWAILLSLASRSYLWTDYCRPLVNSQPSCRESPKCCVT